MVKILLYIRLYAIFWKRKMKKGVVILLLTVLFCAVLTACGFNEVEDINLSFYDGDVLLKQTTLFKFQNGDSIVPQKEGYDFIGWFYDPDCEDEVDLDDLEDDIEEDCSLYAGWKRKVDDTIYYKVTFYDYDGREISSQQVSSLDGINYPSAPERAGYVFSMWDGVPEVLEEDIELWARYLKVCHIYFYARNTDTEPYATREVIEGGQIELPNDPKLPNDDQASYTFIKWNADFSDIRSDMFVYAQFERVILKYTYKFLDADGKVIKSQKVDYGSAILPPSKVVKESDDAYAYTFIGWDLNDDGEVDELPSRIVADFTAKALFSSHSLSFIVSFYNGDELLQSVNVEYGNKAEYTGATPEKESTPQYDFRFIGWDKSLDEIVEATSFYAEYESITRRYTYSFFDEDGTLLLDGEADYGTAIPKPEDPEKLPTNKYVYTFSGWSGYTDGMVLEEDVEFTPVFKESLRKYTYSFYVGSEVVKEVIAEYGEVIVPPADPVREGLIFVGWAGGYYDGMTVDKDRTFTASWKAEQSS